MDHVFGHEDISRRTLADHEEDLIVGYCVAERQWGFLTASSIPLGDIGGERTSSLDPLYDVSGTVAAS